MQIVYQRHGEEEEEQEHGEKVASCEEIESTTTIKSKSPSNGDETINTWKQILLSTKIDATTNAPTHVAGADEDQCDENRQHDRSDVPDEPVDARAKTHQLHSHAQLLLFLGGDFVQ